MSDLMHRLRSVRPIAEDHSEEEKYNQALA
jgi:hypothetical protein